MYIPPFCIYTRYIIDNLALYIIYGARCMIVCNFTLQVNLMSSGAEMDIVFLKAMSVMEIMIVGITVTRIRIAVCRHKHTCI